LVAVETGQVGGNDVVVELSDEVLPIVLVEGGFEEEVGLDGVIGEVDVGLADALLASPDDVDFGRQGAQEAHEPEGVHFVPPPGG